MEEIELDIVIYEERIGKKKVYSISSIQFPNVVTQGNSLEQAKKRLKEALELYFESAPLEKARVIQCEKKEECAPMISRMFL